MIFFTLIASIKAITLGAIYGRIDGGGILKVNEWVERTLVMSFFVLACAPFVSSWSLVALLGMFGIATGHGQYFLDRKPKYIEPEKLDFLVEACMGKDPRTASAFKALPEGAQSIVMEINKYGSARLYWRNVVGLFFTGSLVGLPAALLLLASGWAVGAVLLLTGVCKALSYVVSYALTEKTELAEYLNGGLRTFLCVLVILHGFKIW